MNLKIYIPNEQAREEKQFWEEKTPWDEITPCGELEFQGNTS